MVEGTPLVNSFSPAKGDAGTAVTILGTDFNPTPSDNIVYFGATRASVVGGTTTSLTVTVPAGATYSPVTVADPSRNGVSVSSSPFVPTFAGGDIFSSSSMHPKQDFAIGANAKALAVVDLDGDGKPDLIASNADDNTVSVYRNTGSVGVIMLGARQDIAAGTTPHSIAVGDFDADGKQDLAFVNSTGLSFSILQNTSTSGVISFAARRDYALPADPKGLALGDFDADGGIDVAVGFPAEIRVFRSTGSFNFASPVILAVTNTLEALAASDFNNDQKPDIAAVSSGANLLTVFQNASSPGSISFGGGVGYTTGVFPRAIVAGDLNNDSRVDLIVANNSGNTVSYFRNASSGGGVSFQAKSDVTTGNAPMGLAVGEMNGDGKMDLIVTNSGDATVSVYLNVGSGSFSLAPPATFTTGATPSGVIVADLDGDARFDLATVNSTANSVSILRSRIDQFSLTRSTVSLSQPTVVSGSSITVTLQAKDINGSNVTSGGATVAFFTTGAGTSTVTLGSVTDHNDGTYSASVAGILAGSAVSIGASVNGAVVTSSLPAVSVVPGPAVASNAIIPGGVTIGVNETTDLLLYARDANGNMVNVGGATVVFSLTGGGTSAGTFGSVFDNGNGIYSASFTGTVPGATRTLSATFNGTTIGTSLPLVTVVINPPVIHSLSTTSGVAGSPVVISGTGFSPIPSLNDVYFGPAKATVTAASPTSLTVAVPAGAVYGPVTVLANGLTDQSREHFSKPFVSADSILSFTAVSPVSTNSTPRGVVTGDFNADGKIDVAFANFGSNNINVVLGNGDGTFTSGATIAVESNTNRLTTGYFNGDAHLDIATASTGANVVQYALGNGDGTFASPVNVGASGNPIGITSGDLNNDGKMDLVATGLLGNTAIPLLNFGGSPIFSALPTSPTGSFPQSVILGDFNNDGFLDVVVPSGNDNSFTLRLGVGNGTFGGGGTFGNAGTYVAKGDFDNDGNLDIVTTGFTISIHLGNGSGAFSFSNSFGATGSLFQPVVADFNGDGKLDIAVARNADGLVAIFPGNGDGTFGSAVNVGVGSGPDGIAIGDFNADGRPDLIVTNNGGNNASVLLNTTASGPVFMLSAESIAAGSVAIHEPKLDSVTVTNNGLTTLTITSVASSSAEFSVSPTTATLAGGESKQFMVTTAPTSAGAKSTNIIFTHNLAGSPDTVQVAATAVLLPPVFTSFSPKLAAVGASVTLVGSHFDPVTANNLVYFGGVKAAVVSASTSQLVVTVPPGVTYERIFVTKNGFTVGSKDFFTMRFTISSPGVSFASSLINTGISGNVSHGAAVGDFNNDGSLDLVVSGHTDRSLSVLPGNGAGSFGAASILAMAGTANKVIAADVDADGKVDILASSGDSIVVFRGNGNGTFVSPLYTFAGTATGNLVVADFNNDGVLDVVVACTGENRAAVLPGIGNGTFGARTLLNNGGALKSVVATDFNGDGNMDVAVTSAANLASPSVFLGNGNGTFGSAINHSIPFHFGGGYDIVAGDFNRDGMMDLAEITVDFLSVVVIYSGNGDGTTFLQTYQVMTAPSHALTTSDFNGDGLHDLLTVHTNSGGGDLSVILGQGNGFFHNAVSVGTVTGGQDLITGDFNNDGKADIVSANSTAASGNTAKLFLNGIVLPSGAPVLVSPANGGTVPVTPTLSWNAVSGASTYKVEVATDSTFSSLVFTNAAVASISLVTGQLSGNTLYYWRVTPIGNSGAIGNASLKRNFATGLSVPVPFFPGGGNALSFNGTDGYVSIPDQPSLRLTNNFTLEAWVYPTGSGNMTILDKGNYNYLFSLRPNATTGLGFFTVNTGWVYSGGTVPLNQWSHVAVVVESGTGGVKFYLDGVLLGTATLPAAVVTNNGEVNIGRQAPGNCNCNFFHGQLDEVRIWNVARTDGDIQSSHNRLLGPVSGLVANYRFDEGTGILANDATGNGNTGTLVNGTAWIGSGAPIQTVVPTTTTLQWSVVPNADSYGVQVSAVANFASTVVNQTNIGSNSYAISGLSTGTTYFWRVKAAKPNDTTAYSAASSFNTIPTAPGSAPSLATPADAAVDQQVSLTLGWGSVAGANAYRLQLATDNTFNAVTYDQANIGSTSHVPSGLLNNTTYYWRVSAGNEGGYSSFSSSRSFTTLPDVPASPALSVPIAGATNQPTGFSISWNSVSGASHYGLQVATDSLFTTITANQDSLVGTSAVISGLANNNVYYWRVRGINVAGYGPFSSLRQFETVSNVPAAPGLVAPTNAALNIPFATTLSWNAVGGATSYSLQVSTDSLFSTTIVDLQGISLTTFDLQGLLPNTIYYWHVSGTGVGGAGVYSTTRSFTTIPAAPSAPILALPADGDINRPTTLGVIWNNRPGALTYRLEFSNDGTFATHLIDSTGIADTTFALTGLSQNTTYYWRISGENAGGTGPASPIRSFTTLPPPPGAPVLALPSDGGVHLPITPILSWNSALLAGTYRLLLSTDSTFATSLHDQSGLTDTTFVGSGLTLGTKYFWKVSATNAGGTGPFSLTRSFTTLPVVPAVPVPAVPAHASTDQALSLSVTWNAVPGADTYRAQVSSDSLFSTFVADQSGLAVTSLALNGLTTSTRYYWRVNATNVSGTSAYTVVRSFTTVPPASATPTLTTPLDGAVDIALTPTLNWNPGVGALSYRLQVSTDNTFASTVFDQAGIVATSEAVSGLSASTLYYWRVNASNAGGTSPYTAHNQFTTVPAIPGAPTLASPADAATNQSRNVLLSWNASTGATSYRIQVSTDNTFATSLVDSSGITGTAFATLNLAVSTTYHWRVSASNAGGSGPFSTSRQFSTVPPVPATPLLSSPTNSAANVPTSVLLAWSAASGANGYHLQVATDAAFTSLFVDTSGLNSTVFLLESLQPDILYYWRVSATNIGGANISSVRSFSTVALPPSAPLVVSPMDGSVNQSLGITLAWSPVAGATSYRVQFGTDDTFTTLLVDSTGIDSSQCSLSGLLRSTTYFWRVSAINSGGSSIYSDIAGFTTIPPAPPVPTAVLPLHQATGQSTSLMFQWMKEPQATSYRLQIATDPGFTVLSTDQSAIPDSSVTIHTLSYSTLYYWRVRAENPGGVSPFTSTRMFATQAAPPPPPPPPTAPAVPTLLSPGHGATQQQVALVVEWASVPTATLYRLQVAADSSFSAPLIDRDGLTVTSDSVAGLAHDTTYFWRVRAGNAVGVSPYSAARAFSTMRAFVAVPELLIPTDGAKDVAITVALSWNKADSASFYRLQVANDSLFASLVVDADSIEETSREISGLANAATYWWRVQGKTLGGTSAFSVPRSFTTIVTVPVSPELSSPADNAINQPTAVTFSWNAVAGAQVYHLEAAFDSLFSSLVADVDSLPETSSTLEGLSLNTRYFWRVRAKNVAGAGIFSGIRRFTTVLTTSVEVIAEDVPRVFALSQNYPNPFNPVTRIEFSLPEAGRVSLRVFDAIGRQVAVLFDDEGEPGRRYRATFNGAQVPSGMYFARLEWNGKHLTKKLLLVK
ncbi:MAG: FG-GAP-like repeat-containing protein [Bacteroidota bacterium]